MNLKVNYKKKTDKHKHVEIKQTKNGTKKSKKKKIP